MTTETALRRAVDLLVILENDPGVPQQHRETASEILRDLRR